MQDRPSSRWGAWVAIAAAYLTAFQLVFGGLAPVSAAGIDPVLCAQSTSGGPSHPGPAPAHSPECCLFGCCVAGQALAAGRDIVLAGPSSLRSVCICVRGAVLRLGEPGYAPRQTRGPPRPLTRVDPA